MALLALVRFHPYNYFMYRGNCMLLVNYWMGVEEVASQIVSILKTFNIATNFNKILAFLPM